MSIQFKKLHIGFLSAIFVLAPINLNLHADNVRERDTAEHRVQFSTRLSGKEEVPAVPTEAMGESYVYELKGENALQYMVTVENNTKEHVTEAHLHCAPPGQNGPAVVTLYNNPRGEVFNGKLASGDITNEDITRMGKACDPKIYNMEHLVQAMREGQIYVNVHSKEHPNGFMRGQLEMYSPAHEDKDYSKPDPYIVLSEYYNMPEDVFAVRGFGFENNEEVKVEFMGVVYVVIANERGEFIVENVQVPKNIEGNTQQIVIARGLSSGITRTAQISIGSYYPHVEPTTYYLYLGSDLGLKGSGFAPNEYVTIMCNEQTVGKVRADEGGNVYLKDVQANQPTSPGKVAFTIVGEFSQTPVIVIVHLAN